MRIYNNGQEKVESTRQLNLKLSNLFKKDKNIAVSGDVL